MTSKLFVCNGVNLGWHGGSLLDEHNMRTTSGATFGMTVYKGRDRITAGEAGATISSVTACHGENGDYKRVTIRWNSGWVEREAECFFAPDATKDEILGSPLCVWR